MKIELAVRDVQEIPGANGYIVQAVGHIPEPEPDREVWGLQSAPAIPSWAPQPARDTAAPFFPDAAISVTVQLEWRSFAVPKPGLAEFGTTIVVDIEPGTVPRQPENRGPMAPANRRI